jgi:hypothetical protein
VKDRERLEELVKQMKTAADADDDGPWDTAAASMRRFLTEEEGQQLLRGSALVPPATGDVLEDWWQRGGGAWMSRSLAADGTALEFPPTMRTPADMRAFPIDVVCEEAPCGRAPQFLRAVEEHELRLESYERGMLHSTWQEKTDRRGGMMNRLQRACPRESLQAWSDCVASARSSRFVLPLGDFRLPSEGWLILSPQRMARVPCIDATAVNLRSGDAWWTEGCASFSGEADPESFRELALLAALAGHTAVVSDSQTVGIPAGMPSDAKCWITDDPPRVTTRSAPHARVAYWLLREEQVVASGFATAGRRGSPVGRIIRARYDRARARMRPTSREVGHLELPPGVDDPALAEIVEALSQ